MLPPSQRELPALTLADTLRGALLAVGRTALDAALSETKDTAAVCVVFNGSDGREFRPEAADIGMLAESGGRSDFQRRFVPINGCPRTYASMLLTVGADGRPVDAPPPGYVDPHILRIDVPENWLPKPDEQSVTVMVRVGQGTATNEYSCRVRPSSARAKLNALMNDLRLADVATCRLEKQSIR